jgi:hypothetical protein
LFDLDDSLGTTLNNHKLSACFPSGKCIGGLGGAATKRPPIHINNNLGTSTWGGTGCSGGDTGEKNILKGNSGAKNCRNCPDDKKGLFVIDTMTLITYILDLQVLGSNQISWHAYL